jgi:hypothetical protein
VAFNVLRKIKSPPTNRGIATLGRGGRTTRADGSIGTTNRVLTKELRANGLADASSAVIGFMDRYVRLPFCRKTAFNAEHSDRFAACMDYILAADEAFQTHAPERYVAQMEKVRATHPDFVIKGTAFTTVTVNRNYPTRYHKDAGDLKAGFGVMGVLRRGFYSGGYFTMPRFGVAFDVGNRDILLADVHEVHGNTRIRGITGAYDRVSAVFYYRERMHQCGSMEQEHARAKHRQPGDHVYDPPASES